MRLYKVDIQNFRLLTKVELLLEAKSTVIVGRNNNLIDRGISNSSLRKINDASERCFILLINRIA